MTDINDYIRHPDKKDIAPDVLEREQTLEKWDKAMAIKLAEQDGLTLTSEHWLVIDYLQQYYLQHGWPHASHELSRQLDEHFAEQGGQRYWYLLVPPGPAAQGSRIAGLPLPANVENESMGSVQ